MVIDTSAVLAILLQEPEAVALADSLEQDPMRLMSAVSLLESAIVIEARKGPAGGRELDLLLHRGRIEVVSFNSEQAEIAREAWLRFGKGRHPAGLNLGDCCSYALSRSSGEPLLFKGADFARTDVTDPSVPMTASSETTASRPASRMLSGYTGLMSTSLRGGRTFPPTLSRLGWACAAPVWAVTR